ncbi:MULTISPECIES: beta-N-acetylhexosaminidase [unclassified Moritella]|uniref:beta-N-acetylhexosaminidase n=1 Tax=unclassified Moritella TaxID=2637987 RepID=UPI001BAA1689|nr:MULTISPECIES: beta-N-acetylhexosaminidase [unclassified Moritella]QUM84239.1 beta-N-acetylhexosaminidase [Moritella sp. 28]QUM88540.1 beta-N-acetylhexosaminidase [Moritella sp. 36]
MGPVVVDVDGYELTAEDKEILAHPLTGGLILFSRNYGDHAQLNALIKSIRKAAHSQIVIAVDHEGGRVQRFREQFTRIPAMGKIAALYADDRETAKQFTQQCGWMLAAELLAFDIDLSFAPVLDLERGSQVIGDRSFHADPSWVTDLSTQLCVGMHQAGMKTTGKHFPGHGSVLADSHIALPIDERSLADISATDLLPFKSLIANAQLDAIMPAHVIYQQVDSKAAGFSQYWLQTILRKELGFKGAIFSDDLSMHGASVAGNYLERAEQAIWAGCNLLLACNDRTGVETLLDGLDNNLTTDDFNLKHTSNFTLPELKNSRLWQDTAASVAKFNQQFS